VNVTVSIPIWAKFIVSDFTDMDRSPQAVTSETLSFELPDDAYFEYAFLGADGAMQPDPNNSVKAENPWYPNASAVIGTSYKVDAYATPTVQAEGRVLRLRLESTFLMQTRRMIVYTPKGYENQALPVTYAQDGVAYYRIAKLAEVLEQLLSEDSIRPAHLVFIEPFDRTAEYCFNPTYRSFMTDELVPQIDKELQTTSERVVMGASLGGLASATLALEHSNLFQTVITQSGAFLGSPTELDFYKGKTSWVLETVQERERLPIRWYTEVGTLEWLTDINRNVHDVLVSKGYDHTYAERNAGHNWVNWRNGLAAALKFALVKHT
jgi:enterochelin esterase-like enzyme